MGGVMTFPVLVELIQCALYLCQCCFIDYITSNEVVEINERGDCSHHHWGNMTSNGG